MSNLKYKPIFFCLVGPAGSGKTSLNKGLLADSQARLRKMVSATTRPARPGERDGVDYHFMSNKDFETALRRGDFFETEETHGCRYGQLRSSIVQALNGNEDLVFDIDIRGARSIKGHYASQTVVIFILPPGRKVLEERMILRSPVAAEELNKRMLTAHREILNLLDAKSFDGVVDYCIVNDNFEECLVLLKKIIETERSKFSRIEPDEIQKCWEGQL